MKKLIIAAILLITSSAFAAGVIQTDGQGQAIQGGAPNGFLSQLLTVNSTTVDMTNNIYWSLYSTTACKYRIMPTTAKGVYPAFTIPASERVSFVVNQNTKFINFSGCTSGELSRQ